MDGKDDKNVLGAQGATEGDTAGSIVPTDSASHDVPKFTKDTHPYKCSFCDQESYPSLAVVVGHSGRICAECVTWCAEILFNQLRTDGHLSAPRGTVFQLFTVDPQVETGNQSSQEPASSVPSAAPKEPS